jgi:hypothetical protein
MKEPLRSRKMNQIIREKKESINSMLSDQSFCNWGIEFLTNLRDQKRELSTTIQKGGQR